ncbi:glycoside hydrolase family 15 protein [Streptomyces sp. MNU76]|uniref:glycoside hydrolase family 15 protein n=1 Tax=Streptomyces sp. MNU76 TaxID=2560026 RepID=UPI001E510A46|nr:glycoside hydrolase family 15 protein [Streptomyces sp. MNU76]MCC9711678.1 glycoside hydrolase family 15 protein [Streptomyces sp. MNU76]
MGQGNSGVRHVQERDRYLPIAEHGLLGDGRGSALVGRDGAVGFMCVPRFDSPPLFCGLLDTDRGGRFLIAPQDLRASRQWYIDDTALLVTQMASTTGTIEVTDAFLLRPDSLLEEDTPAGAGALARHVRVVAGSVDLRVLLRPRGDARTEQRDDGWHLMCPGQGLSLHLASSRPLPALDCTAPMHAGEELALTLSWDEPLRSSDEAVSRALEDTARAWRRWSAQVIRDVPQADLVRRSAITLKLLDHIENGAMVAAPTSSLPELVGGSRNWDYRYTWIRDAAYAVFALRRIGLPMEAGGFLHWALATAPWSDRPRVLYDVDGRPPQPETADKELEGYRKSAPVRWGNAAADQIQHDVYGEILDCAFQWAATGGRLDDSLWKRLTVLVEQARRAWSTPDRGIWEVRTPGRPYTYSAAMCQVALDRAARLAHRLNLPGDPVAWAKEAQRLTDHILREAWDEDTGALTEHLGTGGGLDASLLALPLRRVVPADHPRMVATTDAIASRLDAGGGLLYRYLPQQSPDGLDQPEGAFVLCSFWLVDNLAGQGRIDEAADLFERLCSYTSPLGLLPEQMDPGTGAFLGNFPQALSHVGLISSAVVLGRVQRGIQPELSTQAWFS